MNILIIEDNSDHLDVITDALESITEVNVNIIAASSLAEGNRLLLTERFDACLCDLNLPDSPLEQTVEWLATRSFPVPIIILTSINSLQIAKTLLNKGIQDYISKDDISPQLLFRTCRYAIDRWKHQREIETYNKDMKAFCSSLSHDFNGQIIRIKGVSSILKLDLEERLELTPGELTLFEYLNNSTAEIHQLVDDLQHYLAMEYTLKSDEVVDMNRVISKASAALKASVDKEFVINVEKSLPKFRGNATLLHLLFHNLFSNSIKFNENSPVITISFEETDQLLQISVKDNGIGFNTDKSHEIFTPFKRLAHKNSYNGSGLGLSIVKRIIEKHDGSIKVESEIDKGSLFTLNFIKD
ncbi:ATP-binding protein [Pseudocolwellia sp. AS88]|uniref:hybrid sensor histidine kinase/response regulator n=1 Tax=Pseudocolwellia sp. AS88 TaxID=3063958 RepID=UPI0026EE125E|nr:hybrid sensor histidine kinase/response regulator [Pseudocolwellia sp. AS88]MDO7085267.1 ATP-binding protein [Pseudocolwellia sp. AS88]